MCRLSHTAPGWSSCEGNDILIGGEGNDILIGGGLDVLIGGEGDDLFIHGGGSNMMEGGPGDDLVFYVDSSEHYQFIMGSERGTATEIPRHFDLSLLFSNGRAQLR